MSPRRKVRFSLSTTMGWEFAPLLEKCRIAEQLGFAGFYASDHMHGVAGAAVDTPLLEPWTTLAALSGEVRRLRLGVLVSGVTYRHPSMLAKIAATLDVISGGRVDLGMGASWSRDDHVSYGIDFPPLRERLDSRAVTTAWSTRRSRRAPCRRARRSCWRGRARACCAWWRASAGSG